MFALISLGVTFAAAGYASGALGVRAGLFHGLGSVLGNVGGTAAEGTWWTFDGAAGARSVLNRVETQVLTTRRWCALECLARGMRDGTFAPKTSYKDPSYSACKPEIAGSL